MLPAFARRPVFFSPLLTAALFGINSPTLIPST